MVKRLLREPNVVFASLLSICYFVMEIGKPTSSISPYLGVTYMLIVHAYIYFDAVILKSRYLVLGIGVLFVIINVYNLYATTLGDKDIGVILLQYTIRGEHYMIMKRATQRSIYFQIILFSAYGIYTMFVDKTMELMMFATDNIYKSTGTASSEVMNSFALKVKREINDHGIAMV